MASSMAFKPAFSCHRNVHLKTGFNQKPTIAYVARRSVVKVHAEAPETTSGLEKSGPNMKPLKEIQEIMEILPHRSVLKSFGIEAISGSYTSNVTYLAIFLSHSSIWWFFFAVLLSIPSSTLCFSALSVCSILYYILPNSSFMFFSWRTDILSCW